MNTRVEPENDAQQRQIRKSTFRQFNRMVKSDEGERAWLIIGTVIAALFSGWMGYNWGWNDAATPWRALLANLGKATYEATLDNRCVNLALLATSSPEDWPLPDWCAEAIERARLKPEPLNLIVVP